MHSPITRFIIGVLALVVSFSPGFAAEATAGTLTEQDALVKVSEIWQLELSGDRVRQLELSRALAAQPCPDWIKTWARGAITRLTSVGHPLEMEFTAIDGRIHGMSEMKGKVVLVDFWASWCAPCVAALPKLKEMYSKYHAEGFEIFGVSWDSDEAALKEFLKRKQISWPQYFDGKKPGRWGEAFGIGGVPYAILVDRAGRVQLLGAEISEEQLEGKIRALLEADESQKELRTRRESERRQAAVADL
jgi:thiol-disulfide isomerase/thioredoxin